MGPNAIGDKGGNNAMNTKRYCRCLSALAVAVTICLLHIGHGNNVACAAGTEAFKGKLVKVTIGNWTPVGRKSVLVIKADDGRRYTVHTGFKTQFVPHREPVRGDVVTATCIWADGLWAAQTVTYGDAVPAGKPEKGHVRFNGRIAKVTLGGWSPLGRRATLVIENAKGRRTTVHVGFKTAYVPHRTPAKGDRVTADCLRDDEGRWAVETLTYRE